MDEQKPFACKVDGCGMSFTNEDHLHVHTKKHDMVLNLGLGNKTNIFVADQTPTPTRLIRNCEEVGLFEDLQHVNPFEETFRRAVELKSTITPTINSLITTSSPSITTPSTTLTSSVAINSIERATPTLDINLFTGDDTLHTPHVFPHYSIIENNNDGFISDKDSIDRTKIDEVIFSNISDNSTKLVLTNNIKVKTKLAMPTATIMNNSDSTSINNNNNNNNIIDNTLIISNICDKKIKYKSKEKLIKIKTQNYQEKSIKILPKIIKNDLNIIKNQKNENLLKIATMTNNNNNNNNKQLPIKQKLKAVILKSTPIIASSSTTIPFDTINLIQDNSLVTKIQEQPSIPIDNENMNGDDTNNFLIFKNKKNLIFDNINSKVKKKKINTINNNGNTAELDGKNDSADSIDNLIKRKNITCSNREAAKRYRNKVKIMQKDLQNKNKELENENMRLRNEVKQLKILLSAHKDCPISKAMAMGHGIPVGPPKILLNCIDGSKKIVQTPNIILNNNENNINENSNIKLIIVNNKK